MIQMKSDFLSSVEKNIELQAAGLVALAREEFAFAEARGELAHQILADRLRARINVNLEILVMDMGWQKLKILQANSDHLLAVDESRVYAIKLSSLIAIKNLNISTKPANRLEESWSLNSTLRQWMISHSVVSFLLPNSLSLSGEIKRIYQDHFEVESEFGDVALTQSNFLVAVKSREV